jgi:hypothetical protein
MTVYLSAVATTTAPDAKQLEHWLADLHSETFARRTGVLVLAYPAYVRPPGNPHISFFFALFISLCYSFPYIDG